MNSEKDKIRIDTTNDGKISKKKLFFSNLKKIFSLITFIYCCIIPFIFKIIDLIIRSIIRSKSNPEYLLGIEEIENKYEQKKWWNKEHSELKEEEIEELKEEIEELKEEIEELKTSFSEKIVEIGGETCKYDKLDSLLKDIMKFSKESNKLKDSVSVEDKRVIRELKEEIFQEMRNVWKESYISKEKEKDLKYNKVTKNWEVKETSNTELVLREPFFFFLIKPINIFSEKIISLTRIKKENNYSVYFYADAVIKSLIINFIIKKFLNLFSENFFDEKEELLQSLLVKLLSTTFLMKIVSKNSGIIPNKLPDFWQKRNDLEVLLIFTIYEIFFSFAAKTLKAKFSGNYPKLFSIIFVNIPIVFAREILLRFMGVITSKKEMISYFLIFNLIPEKFINLEKKNFPDLEIKSEK